jgi:hypothetical protein
MHKNATKCNKTQSKWCINKHGASKIIDTFETYQGVGRWSSRLVAVGVLLWTRWHWILLVVPLLIYMWAWFSLACWYTYELCICICCELLCLWIWCELLCWFDVETMQMFAYCCSAWNLPKTFFTGQSACRGDQRPYLQPVKRNILFYELWIRALISTVDFAPIQNEFGSLYSGFKGQANKGVVSHALMPYYKIGILKKGITVLKNVIYIVLIHSYSILSKWAVTFQEVCSPFSPQINILEPPEESCLVPPNVWEWEIGMNTLFTHHVFVRKYNFEFVPWNT